MYIIFSSYFCIRTTLDSMYNIRLFHFKHSIIIFSTKVLQYSFTTIHHDPNITIIKIRPGDLCSYENILHFQNFLVFLSNWFYIKHLSNENPEKLLCSKGDNPSNMSCIADASHTIFNFSLTYKSSMSEQILL